ncbi:MAG: 23S rRNA (pseudouridine(1915)-N(3))-methyltransferase RlmH [Firmicutes bacterium]|nr:23S rRNA (pseudouridine(1915)-N(3))-methyltransferase RlmH [Bacillota bacterium]MDD4264263.1 23S rRNA (pseudouridine(1915)-N(3))-methyltransferase RlmH [Bacillota bacterium]MDD4693792.1 23S rRNA (pseudouridine(1915)-N(3))-methyltransferase RlmH [Bacillota bacterium]
MVKIKILALGKIKEKYLRQGIEDYLKRLKPYSQVTVVEVIDLPIPTKEEECKKMLKAEAEKLRPKLEGFKVLLDLEGKELSSSEMARQIDDWTIRGNSQFTFVIGSSLGVDEDFKKEFDFRWSFGPLTFPHQLMRIMLLEQLYRVFRILSGEPYHK